MYLVLCSAADKSARWAYEGLRKRGVKPLELITSEELAYSRLWEHRVGEETPSIKIVLADGRTVSSGEVSGVLNRLLSAPKTLVNFAQGGDRDYALQELTSFYLSWLETLKGEVINRPEPQGFCGRWRHNSEWAILAQRAGLPAPPYRQCADDDPANGYGGLAPKNAKLQTVVVLKGKLFGATMPQKIESACLRFAALAENDLLGVSLFEAGEREWNFAMATPYPDLISGGEELISHLSKIWKGTN